MPKIMNIPLVSLNTAALTGNYQPLSEGLPYACEALRVTNNCANTLLISFDGVTDHEVVLPNSEILLPGNLVEDNCFKQGTTVFVKGAFVAGRIYLSGYWVTL
jgi:hypothetical protein